MTCGCSGPGHLAFLTRCGAEVIAGFDTVMNAVYPVLAEEQRESL